MEFFKYNINKSLKGYLYDEELAYKIACYKVDEKRNYKNTEERNELILKSFELERQIMMSRNIIIKLTDILNISKEDINVLQSTILDFVKYIPFELYPNIVEWINDDTISFIPYNGVSLSEIINYFGSMDSYSNKDIVFIKYKCIRLLSKIIKENIHDKQIIKHYAESVVGVQ